MRGYEIGRPQSGTNARVNLTPQAKASDIRRLTDISIDCITRFKPCVDLDDLLPGAWSEFRRENSETDGSAYATRCSVDPALFASRGRQCRFDPGSQAAPSGISE